jgi:hypothetical protein
MKPTSRIRKPPPSPIRSLSKLLHKGRGKGKARPFPNSLFSIPSHSQKPL